MMILSAILTGALVSPIFMAQAEVVVLQRDMGEKVRVIQDAEAGFGQAIPDDGMTGLLYMARPLNACTPIQPPPSNPYVDLVPIALIARFGCSFEDKIEHATKANFSGAIVFNINSDKLVPMGGTDDNAIPSVFIGYTDAKILMRKYMSNDYVVMLTGEEPFDINAYLLPFAIVVGICFFIMLLIVLYKCVQDHRRSRRHRLPKSALKKLPVIKFKQSEHSYETCCICLEDFSDGEKLRVLPCDHAYHSKCIDPWLCKNKRICPQCRKRVFDHADSSDSDDESRPLLRGGGPGNPSIQPSTSRGQTGGGTFASSSNVRPAALAALQQPGTSAMVQEADLGSAIIQARGRRLEQRLSTDRQPLLGAVELHDDSDSSEEEDAPHSAVIHASIETLPVVRVEPDDNTSQHDDTDSATSLSSSPITPASGTLILSKLSTWHHFKLA